MLRFFVLVCVLSACAGAPANAQAPRERTPQQISDSTEIARLARELTLNARTDSARVGKVYEWIAQNLSYDVQGFLAGRLADGTPEVVYRKRLAVCGGFVGLFERMAREVGIEATPVMGYAKGFTYRNGASTKRSNHAWLAVRIDDRWRLVDPTWASGFVVNGKFERKFSWEYLFVDPNELIFSHFPEETAWQLLSRPMRRAEFERLPMVHRSLFAVGFDPQTIRATASASRIRSFPLVGSRRGVRILSAPIDGTVSRKSTVNVDIIWPGASEVALVSGGVWRQLKREGDRFRGEAVAAESAVSLVGRVAEKEYETLLQYNVQ
jgi:hypothetical protein